MSRVVATWPWPWCPRSCSSALRPRMLHQSDTCPNSSRIRATVTIRSANWTSRTGEERTCITRPVEAGALPILQTRPAWIDRQATAPRHHLSKLKREINCSAFVTLRRPGQTWPKGSSHLALCAVELAASSDGSGSCLFSCRLLVLHIFGINFFIIDTRDLYYDERV